MRGAGSTVLLYGFPGGVFASLARSLDYAGSLAAVELTGDGKLDLLIVWLGGQVLLYIGRSL